MEKRRGMEDAPEVLTTKDIANLIPTLKRSTILRLIHKGVLPAWRLGRKYYISKAALQRWLEELGRKEV